MGLGRHSAETRNGMSTAPMMTVHTKIRPKYAKNVRRLRGGPRLRLWPPLDAAPAPAPAAAAAEDAHVDDDEPEAAVVVADDEEEEHMEEDALPARRLPFPNLPSMRKSSFCGNIVYCKLFSPCRIVLYILLTFSLFANFTCVCACVLECVYIFVCNCQDIFFRFRSLFFVAFFPTQIPLRFCCCCCCCCCG